MLNFVLNDSIELLEIMSDGRAFHSLAVVGGKLFPKVLDECRAAKLRLWNFLSLFRDLQKPTRFSGGGYSAAAEAQKMSCTPTGGITSWDWYHFNRVNL